MERLAKDHSCIFDFGMHTGGKSACGHYDSDLANHSTARTHYKGDVWRSCLSHQLHAMAAGVLLVEAAPSLREVQAVGITGAAQIEADGLRAVQAFVPLPPDWEDAAAVTANPVSTSCFILHLEAQELPELFFLNQRGTLDGIQW